MSSEALHKAKLAMHATGQQDIGSIAYDGLLTVAMVHAQVATAEALEKIAKLLER